MCNFSLLKMVKFFKMGASMPQQLCPLWVCMFTEVSCVAAQFLTPLPLPTLCCSSCTWQRCLRAPLRPAVGTGKEELGHSETGTESGGVSIWFFIKTALLLSAGFFCFFVVFFFFFKWRSSIWNLLEELLQICAFSDKQASLQYLLEESLEIKCILLLSGCKPPWFISEENRYSSCCRIFG